MKVFNESEAGIEYWRDLAKMQQQYIKSLEADLTLAIEALESLLNNHFKNYNGEDVIKARECLAKIKGEKK
jgi:hypothetical protein